MKDGVLLFPPSMIDQSRLDLFTQKINKLKGWTWIGGIATNYIVPPAICALSS